MSYLEVIPSHPEENMPLIIYLHGDGGFDGNPLGKYIYNEILPKTKEEFIYIAPTTALYSNGRRWDDSFVITELKKLIDKVVEEYKIDKKRITIMGYSRGAIGTWDIVSKNPGYFRNAVPVSCRSTAFKAESFKNTRVWAFVGSVGSNELGYASVMQGYVDRINAIGGQAQLEQIKGNAHGNMVEVLMTITIYDWALD